jgi:hypothetical protein
VWLQLSAWAAKQERPKMIGIVGEAALDVCIYRARWIWLLTYGGTGVGSQETLLYDYAWNKRKGAPLRWMSCSHVDLLARSVRRSPGPRGIRGE